MKNTLYLLVWMIFSIVFIFLFLLVLGLYIWPIFGLKITMIVCVVIAVVGFIELVIRRL